MHQNLLLLLLLLFLIGKKVILLIEKNKKYIKFTVVNKEQLVTKRNKGIKILF